MLDELAGIGMRVARVIAALSEIEQAACEAAARWLPMEGEATCLSQALVDGQGMDAVEAAVSAAVPRVEVLARALDRVGRSVRRSVALRRRLDAGWPRHAGSDDRQAMVRRQVARGVSEAIRSRADGEAAERLFDELAARLDDPAWPDEVLGLPVDAVVQQICLALGLGAEAVRGLGGAVPGVPGVVDTG